MAGPVFVSPAPVQAPAVASHARVTVTNSATAIDALTGGTIPTNDGRAPNAVYLGVEPGAGTVYITWDGQSTPAATLGFIVPSTASPMYVPIAPDIKAGQIKLIATVNPTYVQAKWEFGG